MLPDKDTIRKLFMFRYKKLFGVKGTPNEATQRLFYVACSRAEESLALVAYSADP